MSKTAIGHVAIYIDAAQLIDSTDPGVAVRPFAGWYQTRLSRGRRIFGK